jgi:hypothetical protein
LATLLLFVTSVAGPTLGAEVFEFCDHAQVLWLKIEYGARGEALAGAYSALAEGLSDTYWTPAGLAFCDGIEFAETGHLLPETEWVGVYDVSFIGCSISGKSLTDRLPLGTLAAWRRDLTYSQDFWYHLGQYRPDGEARITGFSYGHLLVDGFGIGLTYKKISSDWDIFDEEGHGWDIGAILRRDMAVLQPGVSLRIGAATGIRNLGHVKVRYEDFDLGKSRLPRRAYLGIALTLSGDDRIPWQMTLSLEETYADYIKDSAKARRSSIGLEVGLMRAIAFRYGWRESKRCYSDKKTAGVGAALRYGNIAGLSLDWARTDLEHFDELERWSLSLNLLSCSKGLDLKPLFVK